ncbi:MAG: hypothetical protein NTW54_04960 [Bacteroidetes bacterium]|nr:hypothetical protein [Bacteroidota bacterium]
MKSLKSLFILAVSIISAFVLTSSSCGSTCVAPEIVFNPSGTTLTKAPGEVVAFSIVVTGSADNIKSIKVSKSSNGVLQADFISIPSVGEKGKTVALVDTIPSSITYGSVITYTVTAVSDCKDATADTKTMTVTIGPSSTIIPDSVGNNSFPRVYSRWSLSTLNNSAYQLLPALDKNNVPLDGRRFASQPNDEKDIRDTILIKDPFKANVRWGSRNGSKFVKLVGFNWATASPQGIIAAYNSGTPTDIVTFTTGDLIVVNIKNKNTYALVKIKTIVDTGSADDEDYTQFSYKLAQ